MSLVKSEKKTFIYHLSYSFLDGIVLGVLSLNEFIFLKSINGSAVQLGYLFQFSMVVFLFLLFFNEFMRRAKSRKKMLIITGLITRAPLFLLALFPNEASAYLGNSIYHYLFLAIFLVYFFGALVINPTINLFLKNSYSHSNFGKLYSYSSSLNKLVMLVVVIAYGRLLDTDYYAFRYMFPIIAIISIISIIILAQVKYKEIKQDIIKLPFFKSVKKSATRMYVILRDNKPYRDFELGFMMYGIAFMISITVITLFWQKELGLNYTSLAFYKNVYYLITIMILPFFGMLIGKIDPRRFAVITFASIALHIFFIALTQYFPFYTQLGQVRLYYTLIPYIIFHSIFAATMGLLWNIGSAYFCKDEDVSDYQSTHLFLTGFRALFAPLFGVYFYFWVGYTGTFALAIFMLIIGMFIMNRSYKRDKLKV